MSEECKIKLKAFTLPELLVTLVTLGIIFIIIIPSMISNIRDSHFDAQNQEATSIFKQACVLIISNNDMMGYSSTAEFFDVAKKYMNVNKICTTNLSDCFAENFTVENTRKNVSEYTTATALGKSWGTETVGFVLNDGVSGLIAYNPDCYGDTESQKLCVAILYDTNGKDLTNSYVGVNGKSDLGTFNASYTGAEACDISIQKGHTISALGADRDTEECKAKIPAYCNQFYGSACRCTDNGCSF